MVTGKVKVASSGKVPQKGAFFSRCFGVCFTRTSAQVHRRQPDVSELLRLVEELQESESQLKTQLLRYKLLGESVAILPALEKEIAGKDAEIERSSKKIDCLEEENDRLRRDLLEEKEEHEKKVKAMEDQIAELKRAMKGEQLLCSQSEVMKEESTQLKISAEQSSSSEVCNEEESGRHLKLDSSEEDQLLSSPLASPPSSSVVKHIEDVDNPNGRSERPSAVFVLESSFTEDVISPAGIKSRHVEPPMQPQRIHFEEQLSPAVDNELCVGACTEDDEESAAFQYVEAILLASDLNWEEFLLRWLSSNQILDPSLFDEVELFPNMSSHDQKLLFDCTNEVLKEVCERYFGSSPWKPNIRPIPRGKDLIQEIWKGVEWHLLSQPSHTLDHIVRKDMTKNETWMDLGSDFRSIGIAIEEVIFDELVEDTISSFYRSDNL